MSMNKIEPRTLKGFPDFLPDEQLFRQSMFERIQNVFARFGFSPMSTPAVEYKEILLNKYGDEEKLVYSFQDQGGRDVALRYDLTVPLARFVAQHQHELIFPFKRYQIAPVWRAENTQRGRLREFYQCDVDIIGTESVVADTEIVACLCKALEEVGVSNYVVRLNDRGIFNLFTDRFGGSIEQGLLMIRALDKYYKIGREGVLDILREQGFNPEWLRHVEDMIDLGTGQQAIDRIRGHFPERPTVTKPIENILELIHLQGVSPEKILFDPLIARGLDYYTGLVFEVQIPNRPELGSIAGGGRYNSLVDQFSTTPLPAVGGSLGVDRIYEALRDQGVEVSIPGVGLLIMHIEPDLLHDYISILTELRSAGVYAEVYFESAKWEKQFKYAEGKHLTHAIILGREELEQGIVQVKDLTRREQAGIPRHQLVQYICNLVP